MNKRISTKYSIVLFFLFVGTALGFAQKYEAENAAYGGGAVFHNEDPGYSGTGFVRNFSYNGQYVEFSIAGATAGSQDVYLRYTTGEAGSLHLYVNGTMIRKVNIPTTGGWSNWQDYAVNVTLNAGSNTIKFQRDAGDTGLYYIDCLTVAGVSPEPGENKVVFMGNSITQFWETSHPVFFSENPYINKGISGQTTSQMLSRFQNDVIKLKPAAVVIEGGTNDIAGNSGPTTIEQIMKNIASMAQLAKTNGIQVVLSSVLPADHYSWSPNVQPIEKITSLNILIKAYAQDNGMIYADFYSSLVNAQKGMKAQYSNDGVHPNLAGYEVMEPIVKDAINKAISLASVNPVHNFNCNIAVFPNPFSTGLLSVKLPVDATQLSILDATGKLIYQIKVTKNEILIDNSMFETDGIYFVNVLTKTNSINKKLIIVK